MIYRLLSPVFRLAARPKLELIPLTVVPQAPSPHRSALRQGPAFRSNPSRIDFTRAGTRSTNQVSS
jgi:hypothetical protein